MHQNPLQSVLTDLFQVARNSFAGATALRGQPFNANSHFT